MMIMNGMCEDHKSTFAHALQSSQLSRVRYYMSVHAWQGLRELFGLVCVCIANQTSHANKILGMRIRMSCLTSNGYANE